MASELPQSLRAAITLLDEVAEVLADFTENNFTEACAKWKAWQSRIINEQLLIHFINPIRMQSGEWLRGLIDRHPNAPQRGLPKEVEELFRKALGFGPGRTTTWAEFEAKGYRNRLTDLTGGIPSFKFRLNLLLAYVGMDPIADNPSDPQFLVAGNNDARDKFIYESRAAGKSNAWIKQTIENKSEWEQLHTVQSVSQAAKRYASRNHLPWPINNSRLNIS